MPHGDEEDDEEEGEEGDELDSGDAGEGEKRPAPSTGGAALPPPSRSPTRSPKSSVKSSRSSSRTPAPSPAPDAPSCGVGSGPVCRHWTWACDMARVNANAGNSTWWEKAGGGPAGLHRLYIDVPGCDTRELSYEHVTQCLKGKHIIITGDSISRYQFYSLVQFLELKKWHPRINPASEHTRGWKNGFNGLYAGVNKRLGGHEICDCGRDDKVTLESHYYYSPAHGIRVTFLWRTGTNKMSFHPLRWVGERCVHEQWLERRRAMNEGRWGDAVRGLPRCAQRGCAPGSCQGTPYDSVDDIEGVKYFVRKLEPDALVMNVGLWTNGIDEPRRVQQLIEMGRYLKARHPRLLLVWKTTTFRDPSGGQRVHENPPRMLAGAGWRISDAGGATAAVRAMAQKFGPGGFYRDFVHFQPWVYRGLNELLLADLCSKHLEWP